MRHVVMCSGGIGSWATAQRVREQHGSDNLTLLFADVGGKHTSPHVGEGEDTYRFIRDTATQLDAELIILNEGRDIWEVFKDDRFLGNSRLANCSKYLKQRPCREWLDANCDPNDTTVYVGIDWSEMHRLPAIVNAYKPFKAEAPMVDPPYVDKQQLLDLCRETGVEPPAAYKRGASHNNCQQFCVRAGHAQMRHLLATNRDAFMFHEGKEQELRDYLDKDVAVLKDRRGGTAVPLTLQTFRERIESNDTLFELDEFDFGGCGCFVDDPS